jgi:hypothetical protein
MTRARWMLGALGALATIAFVPALPASASHTDVDRSTDITNVVDGSHWAVMEGPEIRAVQGQVEWLGKRAEWSVSRHEDGSVTIRNSETRECAEADMRFSGIVRVAPCESWKETQNWRLQERANGYVISPRIAPDLAVSVQPRGYGQRGVLALQPQAAYGDSAENAGMSIFRLEN